MPPLPPKGLFFCEVAAALDMVFNDVGGWPVALDWWKKTPKDYVEQMNRYCTVCGVPYPLKGRLDSDGIDDISYGNYKKLKALDSPKIRQGKYHLYTDGIVKKTDQYNDFRNNTDYFNRIAEKFGIKLKQNEIGYLEPLLV